MAYLTYIEDEILLKLVEEVLEIGINKKETVLKDLNKNVIDPFGVYFKSGAFDLDYGSWLKSEMARQCQKTLENSVGYFHQKNSRKH